MIQEQEKKMLSSLTEDEEIFKDFYRKGYFAYSNDEGYKGKVAIINNAIISLMEDENDESKVVATIDFQNSGTFIYKLIGDDYYFSQFGKDPTVATDTGRVYLRDREEVINDIATIRRHCLEAEEKSNAIQNASSIVSKFSSISVKSDNAMSIKDAFVSLGNTFKKLDQSKQLEESDKSDGLDK